MSPDARRKFAKTATLIALENTPAILMISYLLGVDFVPYGTPGSLIFVAYFFLVAFGFTLFKAFEQPLARLHEEVGLKTFRTRLFYAFIFILFVCALVDAYIDAYSRDFIPPYTY